jgi:hypothetical protein
MSKSDQASGEISPHTSDRGSPFNFTAHLYSLGQLLGIKWEGNSGSSVTIDMGFSLQGSIAVLHFKLSLNSIIGWSRLVSYEAVNY